MKIIFTSDLSGLGGGETGIAYLAEELDRNHDVRVICRRPGSLVDLIAGMGIPVNVVDYKRRSTPFSSIHKLSKILRDFDPDVVVSNDPVTSVIMHLAAKGLTQRNSWLCHGQWYCFSPLKKRLIQRSNDKILCVSDCVRDSLEKQGMKNCETVGLGVPLKNFEKAVPADLRQEFGLGSTVKIILTIARYQRIKGQMRGVQAVEDLLDHGYDCVYILIGGSVFGSAEDGAFEAEVRDYIFKSRWADRIIMAGERSDIPACLKAADVLLIPSENESLGVVALEALAAGLPVVSTPNEGVSEIMKKDSTFVASSFQPQALSALIGRRLAGQGHYSDDECSARMSQIRQHYSVEAAANRLLTAATS